MSNYEVEQRRRVFRQLRRNEPIAVEDRAFAESIARVSVARTPARRLAGALGMLFFVAILLGAIFGDYSTSRRIFAGVGAGLFVLLGAVTELIRLRWRRQLKQQSWVE